MKRKIFALLLVVLLIGSLSLSAAADAYIPPERIDGFDMNYAYMENGNCKALNTFLSNFAEVGLTYFDANSPDADLIAATLKHLELNAGYYTANVKQVAGPDGAPYMQVNGSFFEQRMAHLFGRSIPASSCPGYEDGYIEVSADHFGGPIQVFASVFTCLPMDGDVYQIYFDVFRVDVDFSGWYTTAYPNLPWDKLTNLGSGTARVLYEGGKTNETISTSDFALLELQMDVENLPCRGANVPYGYAVPTVPAETEPVTEAPTEVFLETPVRPREEKELDEEIEIDAPEISAWTGPSINLVLIIILVIAVVLLALILLVFFIVRKKER